MSGRPRHRWRKSAHTGHGALPEPVPFGLVLFVAAHERRLRQTLTVLWGHWWGERRRSRRCRTVGALESGVEDGQTGRLSVRRWS
jgi:hypothetical protein